MLTTKLLEAWSGRKYWGRPMAAALLLMLLLIACSTPPVQADPEVGEPELLLLAEALPGGISLVWTDEGDSSEGYVLERRVGAEPFNELARLPGGTRQYVDHEVSTGNIYTYRVTTQRERVQVGSNLAGETVAVPVSFDAGSNVFTLPGSVITVGGQSFKDTAFLPPNRIAMVEVGAATYLVNPNLGISELTLRGSARSLSLDGFTAPSLDQRAITLSTGIDLSQVGPATGDSATYRFTNRKHRWVVVEIIEPGGARNVHYLQANGSLLNMGIHELISGADQTAPGAPAIQDLDVPAGSTVRVYGSFARGALGYYVPFLRDASFRNARSDIQRTNELLYVKLNTLDLIDFLWQPIAGVVLDTVGIDDATLEQLSGCFLDFAGDSVQTFVEDTLGSIGGGFAGVRAAQQSLAELQDSMMNVLGTCATAALEPGLAVAFNQLMSIVGIVTLIGDYFVANVDVASTGLFNEFQMPQLTISYHQPVEPGGETLVRADDSRLFDFSPSSIEWHFPGETASAPGTALMTTTHSFGEDPGPRVTLTMALTSAADAFTSGQLMLSKTAYLDLSLGQTGFPYAAVSGQWAGPLTDPTGSPVPVRLSLDSHAPINGVIGQLVYNDRYCFVALNRQPEAESVLTMTQDFRGGAGICYPEGPVEISQQATEELHVAVRNDAGAVEWSGVLTRMESHSISTAVTAGNLPTTLYNVGLSAYGYDQVLGPVITASGQSVRLFDLAYCPDGSLYGVTSDTLYQIDSVSLVATVIRRIGGNSNALVCSVSGALYVGVNDRLVELDRTTGHGIDIGRLGVSGSYSGDLVFGDQGRLYATLTGSPNRLAVISLHTGRAQVIGPVPLSNAIHGLSYANGILYGLSNEGRYGYLFEIDPETADSTFLRYMWFAAYGSNSIE